MLSVFIEAFIHFLVVWIYLAFNKGIDLKRGEKDTVLKMPQKCENGWLCRGQNFSKGIVSFFLYQNWLDPSKEIKKQIRGKCNRHILTLAVQWIHAHTRTHSILMSRQFFTEQSYWWFVHSWLLEFRIFCQVLPPGPLCAHWRHHQVGLNTTYNTTKTYC